MEWISVNDKMPEKGKQVLIFSKNRIFHAFWDCASSICGDWYDIQNLWIIEEVTHWMPIPPIQIDQKIDLDQKIDQKIDREQLSSN